MASDRRRHGHRTRVMTLSPVKWSSPLRGYSTPKTQLIQSKIWGATIHFHCVSQENNHREKIDDNHNGININRLFNTAVSRPVGRKEMMEDDDARKSMRKEWLGQHAAGVYDFSIVREYDDVVAEAKKSGKEVHMARIHGICVEKNYQLPKGNPNQKFKGRGVLLGDQVKNQFWEAAFFQDLGNSPATFEASRWVDFYGCLPGNDVKLADAIQAYIQAIYWTTMLGTSMAVSSFGSYK